MSAEQCQLFEETLAEDEASLLRQLAEAQGDERQDKPVPKRQPRREKLPEQGVTSESVQNSFSTKTDYRSTG